MIHGTFEAWWVTSRRVERKRVVVFDLVAEIACRDVVVDETGCLHQRIHGGRSDERPPSALEVLVVGDAHLIIVSVPLRKAPVESSWTKCG